MSVRVQPVRGAVGAIYDRAPTAEEVHWQLKGLCRHYDPQLWTPDPVLGDPGFVERKAQEAKEICLQCPVIMECRAWALRHEETNGVWGGLTEGERDQILTGRKPRRGRRYNRIAEFYSDSVFNR